MRTVVSALMVVALSLASGLGLAQERPAISATPNVAPAQPRGFRINCGAFVPIVGQDQPVNPLVIAVMAQCLGGNERYSAGLAFGGTTPLNMDALALDSEGYVVGRVLLGHIETTRPGVATTAPPVDISVYLGGGGNAFTKSGSMRSFVAAMLHMIGPIELFLGATVNYYPESWGWAGSTFNANQFDGSFRAGLAFTAARMQVIPFLGMGFPSTRMQGGVFVAFPLN
ncbi:MAG: hypothetical protein WCV84_00180 [Patescibacteria group bacterium]